MSEFQAGFVIGGMFGFLIGAGAMLATTNAAKTADLHCKSMGLEWVSDKRLIDTGGRIVCAKVTREIVDMEP